MRWTWGEVSSMFDSFTCGLFGPAEPRLSALIHWNEQVQGEL
jgi:hypothetical protein